MSRPTGRFSAMALRAAALATMFNALPTQTYAQFAVPGGFSGSFTREIPADAQDPTEHLDLELSGIKLIQHKCDSWFWITKNFALAEDWNLLLSLAQSNDVCAEYHAGSIMTADRGFPDTALNRKFNFQQGIEYLQQAETIDPSFGTMLFYLLMRGAPNHGIAPEKQDALKYLVDAHKRGDTIASAILGSMYMFGAPPLINKSVKTGIEVLFPAAENGQPYAQLLLGEVYATGDQAGGVDPDLRASLKYLTAASAQGVKRARSDIPKVQAALQEVNTAKLRDLMTGVAGLAIAMVGLNILAASLGSTETGTTQIIGDYKGCDFGLSYHLANGRTLVCQGYSSGIFYGPTVASTNGGLTINGTPVPAYIQ